MEITKLLSELIKKNDSATLDCELRTDSTLANAKYEKRTGASFMHLAVSVSSNDCLEVLLLHNANPSVQDSSGISPLHIAAERNNLNACKLLVEFGCNVKARDANGIEAFDIALTNKSHEIINTLRSRAYPKRS